MKEKAARSAHFNTLFMAVVAFFAVHVFAVFILPTLVGRVESVIDHSLPLIIVAGVVEIGLLLSLILRSKKYGAVSSILYGSMLLYVGVSHFEIIITPLYVCFALLQTAIASVLWKSYELDKEITA